MAAFFGSLFGYLIKFTIIAAMGAAGIFLGKKFRDKKDAKKVSK